MALLLGQQNKPIITEGQVRRTFSFRTDLYINIFASFLWLYTIIFLGISILKIVYLYYYLMSVCMFVFQPLNVDSVWTVIFGVPACKPMHLLSRETIDLCPDAALVLLAMIRQMINEVGFNTTRQVDDFFCNFQNGCHVGGLLFGTCIFHKKSESKNILPIITKL